MIAASRQARSHWRQVSAQTRQCSCIRACRSHSSPQLLQLATQASEAPVPYALSAFAAVVYIVATFAIATDRRRLALVAVSIELVGVLTVGFTSLLLPNDYPDSTVWSDFGLGYGLIPLVLPLVGLWWLLRHKRVTSVASGP